MSKATDNIINLALREDIGNTDITTRALIPQNAISNAAILMKEEGMICGLDVAKKVFQKIDRKIKFTPLYRDGDRVHAHVKVALITARTRALLTAERVALNFLSHLSGIATKTHAFVQKVQPYNVKIMDTRKTIPGLRVLEKYAVRCAGGRNHRFRLGDMILIKDNHKTACRKNLSLRDMIYKAKMSTKKTVEVEVENLTEFKEAFAAKPDIILLDNMALPQIREAVRYTKGIRKTTKPVLEVSGRVNLENVRAIAKTGVGQISIGELTHSAKAIDFSMDFLR